MEYTPADSSTDCQVDGASTWPTSIDPVSLDPQTAYDQRRLDTHHMTQ